MKKMISLVVCLALAMFTGCSANAPQQSPDAETPTPAREFSKPQIENTTPAETASPKEPDLPVLDQTASDALVEFSLKIPSDWLYHYESDHEDEDEIILVIKSSNSDVYMWARQIIIGTELTLEEYWELLKEDFETADFSFSDGGKGYCRKANVYTDFAYFTYDGAIIFSINHSSDPQWYNENEALVYAIAKTLALSPASPSYISPGAPGDNNLPEVLDITVVREGMKETYKGTLAVSERNGYGIYLLPDYKYGEENGVVYIEPKPESGIMSEIMMIIYMVPTNTPVSESFEEYNAYNKITIVSEFKQFTVGAKTFEIQFMYPSEAAEGGLAMLRAMADTLRAVK